MQMKSKYAPGFPAAYWHQETGERRVFERPEDLTDEWKDKHPNHNDGLPPPPPASIELGMTRDEVIAALVQGGIPFKKNAGTAALYKQLVEALQAFLFERKIEFPEKADAKELMALVPAAE